MIKDNQYLYTSVKAGRDDDSFAVRENGVSQNFNLVEIEVVSAHPRYEIDATVEAVQCFILLAEQYVHAFVVIHP